MSCTSMFVTAVVTTAPFLSSTGWWSRATYRSPIVPPAERAQERPIDVVERRRREQIRTTLERHAERLLAPPPGDRGVIAREQHVRHARAPELRRPRVLRTLEQTAHERVVGGRGGVAEHARQQPDDRVEHDGRG